MYDKYLNDKKSFRKLIRECSTSEELISLLDKIATTRTKDNNAYRIYVDNRYCIQTVDIAVWDDGSITCYFDYMGKKSFKDIKKFSYCAELVRSHEQYNSFGVSDYR